MLSPLEIFQGNRGLLSHRRADILHEFRIRQDLQCLLPPLKLIDGHENDIWEIPMFDRNEGAGFPSLFNEVKEVVSRIGGGYSFHTCTL